MAPISTAGGMLGEMSAEQHEHLQRLWSYFIYLVEESSLDSFEAFIRANTDLHQVLSHDSLSSLRSPYLAPPSLYPRRTSVLSKPESITSRKSAGTFLRPHHAHIIQAFREAGLSVSQVRSIRRFLACMSPDEVRVGLFTAIKNEHPDVYLVRYLRVSKWDVNRALAKMLDALVWRFRVMQVEKCLLPRGELYALQQEIRPSDKHQGETGKGFLAQLRSGKFVVRGLDRMNRPICIMRMKLHHPGAQTDAALHQFLAHTVESVRLLVSPPVESATVFLDMTGFTLANMEYGPVKFILRCFETYYPESLGVLLVHNAPPVFAAVWNIIKGWLDDDLVTKIHFTRNINDLEPFIDRDNILAEYGGNDTWEYQYPEPEFDENWLMNDYATRNSLLDLRQSISDEFIAATARWIAAIRVGDRSMLSQAITCREKVAQDLSDNYWDLDPYVRARNYLDRMKMMEDIWFEESHTWSKPSVQLQTAKIMQVAHVERAKLRVVNV